MSTTADKSVKNYDAVETDPRVDAEAQEKMITARVGLLLKAPFFGNLATRLKFVNADKWLPTAATDGRHFYYNSKFIKSLSLRETEFLFGHEVLHVVYDHIGRRGDRDPKIWNIADDYCVNADLLENRIGERIVTVPILYNKKYIGWSAEEVYNDLMENADEKSIEEMANQLLDDHLDGEGDDGDGNGDSKEGNGRPKLTDEERQAIRDEVKEAMLAAAEAAGANNLPSGVKRLIKDLTEPVINWRDLLEQQIQSVLKDDFTWAKPSRRGWHSDAILPGMRNKDTIDICVAIDTSGSISESDLRDFMSEVKGIVDMYEDYKISILSWDTSVHNFKVYEMSDGVDIAEYEAGGGGGTDPHCVWHYLQENEIEPKRLIMFTDYCFWGWDPKSVEDYCETVWIIKDNPSAEPEFGIWAHYNESKKGA